MNIKIVDYLGCETEHHTKHGSPHIRRMLIKVTHAISRTRRNSKLKRFYLSVRARSDAIDRQIDALVYELLRADRREDRDCRGIAKIIGEKFF